MKRTMPSEKIKLLIVVMVFLALIIALAWPDRLSPRGTDPVPAQSSKITSGADRSNRMMERFQPAAVKVK
jgi:hypothetical protein